MRLWFKNTKLPRAQRIRQHIQRQDLRPPPSTELIQRRLEVIQDNAISEAFEDKRKLPEWVDDSDWDHGGDGEEIDDDPDEAETHAEE
jgi:hypothetical protein